MAAHGARGKLKKPVDQGVPYAAAAIIAIPTPTKADAAEASKNGTPAEVVERESG